MRGKEARYDIQNIQEAAEHFSTQFFFAIQREPKCGETGPPFCQTSSDKIII